MLDDRGGAGQTPTDPSLSKPNRPINTQSCDSALPGAVLWQSRQTSLEAAEKIQITRSAPTTSP